MALDILNAKKVADNGLLSKIQIGGKTYEIKDLIAREAIEELSAKAYIAYTNIFADDAAIKSYVDSQVGAIKQFNVSVVETLPTASAETMYILYLVSDKSDEDTGAYVEWITVRSGEEGSYTYTWEAIGSTKIDLSDYITTGKLTEALAAYTKTADLGDLALKDSATGTVGGQTISGVKATGTTTGSITVELKQSEHDMASAGKYTPAGNVTGTVQTAGSINVTAKYDSAEATLSKGDYTPAGTVSANFSHAATAATLEKGDYTPAGTVTANFGHESVAAELTYGSHAPEGTVAVTLSGGTFNAITSVGTQASFVEGTYTPASLSYDAVEKNVAKEGLVGKVEDECLTFSAAGLEAISASKVTAFNGGSKAADTFVANSLPTMAEQNVGVQSATFTGTAHDCVTGVKYDKASLSDLAFSGTKAEGALVTGVSYDKASLSDLAFAGTKAEGALVTGVSYQKAGIDTATFTGETVDISAKFAGTEGDISVTGKCHDYAVETAKFNGAAVELAVGDIVVAEKSVTVN